MSILGKRIRIVNQLRFTIVLSVLIIAVFSLMMFSFNKVIARDQGQIEYDTYTVKNGDTLWSIAYDNIDESIDIREYIYSITTANEIQNNAVIQPGQEIKLPVGR